MSNRFRIIGYVVSNCDEQDDEKMLEAVKDSLGASKLEVDPPDGVEYEIATYAEAKELGAIEYPDPDYS